MFKPVCINCQHYKHEPISSDVRERIFSTAPQHQCHRDMEPETSFDVVTGKVRTIPKKPRDCRYERTVLGKCGEAGELWESRK